MTLDSEEKPKIDYPIHGEVAPGYEKVCDAFVANFESGVEVGASFAVYLNGEKIVDLWGGFADKAKTMPWKRDSLTNVWSTTKGMAATVMAQLVEKGLLDYSAPVADYWPEFGANGKDKIKVGQMLSHQSGLATTRDRLHVEDFYDLHNVAGRLAAAEPLWEPCTRSGYHLVTFGELAGELAFRVSGKSLGTLFADNIAGPLGADVFIGLPESEEPRVVELVPYKVAGGGGPQMTELQKMAFLGQGEMIVAPNTRAWRASEIPAAGGQANAEGVARVYGALANGGTLDGVHVLEPETIALATTEEIDNTDLILGVPLSWGRGFIRNKARLIYGPNPEAFGHSGWGGSFGCADPSTGIGMSYVMNRMESNLAGDIRGLRLSKAVYDSL